MFIATAGENVAKVGRVHAIPPNPMIDTTITIHWLVQERAPHKPRWMRYFKLTHLNSRNAIGNIMMKDLWI